MRTVLIAGGGIAGLTLANTLERAGVDAVVLERAEALSPAGAGITVQPNALAALRTIGLADRVAAEGAAVTEASIRRHDGLLLSRTTGAVFAREFGAPLIALHRARLQAALFESLERTTVRTSFAVADWDETAAGVTVRAADGEGITGSVLAGADGLHSTVRARLFGAMRPDYAGYTSWRGVSDAGHLVAEGRTSETWGAGRRFGIVPIGHGQVYWFATANAEVGGSDGSDVRGELKRRFEGWHEPIESLIEATAPARIIRTDIFDRPPVTSWSRGAIVLLGDAAHPMTPNMGQGGCQAIEDAVVLGRALGTHRDPRQAFAEFEGKRVARADQVVRQSRRFGQMAQWDNATARALRDTFLRWIPEAVTLRPLRDVLTFTG